jgi:DNA invertase Pin-like site-specific DNA recombinase
MATGELDLVGYLRVSTEDQKDRGSSLVAQEAKIRALADRLGHRLVEVIDDGGESARSLDRPGIRRALAMLSAGQASGLLVANLDRLTRNLGDMVQLVETHFTKPDGSVLLSASEPVETRTAVGRMQLFILATFSQYMLEAGVERTAGVMRSKRSRSERTGNLRFGQSVDPSDPRRSRASRPVALVECPEDLAVEEMIVEFRSSGLTLRAIAEELNRQEIPSKRGVTRRSTGRWSKSSIHEILRRHHGES